MVHCQYPLRMAMASMERSINRARRASQHALAGAEMGQQSDMYILVQMMTAHAKTITNGTWPSIST